MKKYLSQTDIKNSLKEMTIIIDSRENQNQYLIDYFDKKKILHITRKLDVADYSAMLGDYTLEGDISIEVKRSIDEIAGNLTTDRQRFENEFLRAKASGTKVFLLIENCSWADIECHNYRSALKPQSLLASLFAWQVRYNITILFCKSSETGKLIHRILYYAAREALKEGVI